MTTEEARQKEARAWIDARIAEAESQLSNQDERELYAIIHAAYVAPGMRTGAQTMVDITKAIIASDWLASHKEGQA